MASPQLHTPALQVGYHDGHTVPHCPQFSGSWKSWPSALTQHRPLLLAHARWQAASTLALLDATEVACEDAALLLDTSMLWAAWLDDAATLELLDAPRRELWATLAAVDDRDAVRLLLLPASASGVVARSSPEQATSKSVATREASRKRMPPRYAPHRSWQLNSTVRSLSFLPRCPLPAAARLLPGSTAAHAARAPLRGRASAASATWVQIPEERPSRPDARSSGPKPTPSRVRSAHGRGRTEGRTQASPRGCQLAARLLPGRASREGGLGSSVWGACCPLLPGAAQASEAAAAGAVLGARSTAQMDMVFFPSGPLPGT